MTVTPNEALKPARRCTGFILIFIQFCELLNRGGVQSLSLDAVIALGVGGVSRVSVRKKIAVLFKRLDASSQKDLLREIVERVVVDPGGKVLRIELVPPFSYLHGLSDRIRNADGGDDGDGKTKASVKAGSCSISIASGGPEGLRYFN